MSGVGDADAPDAQLALPVATRRSFEHASELVDPVGHSEASDEPQAIDVSCSVWLGGGLVAGPGGRDVEQRWKVGGIQANAGQREVRKSTGLLKLKIALLVGLVRCPFPIQESVVDTFSKAGNRTLQEIDSHQDEHNDYR